MDFRVEEIAPCRKKVTVTVPAAAVKTALDARYEEINDEITLPGFRPGHAPRKLLESRFGTHVRDEVKGKIVEEAFKKGVEEKKYAPLGQPNIDVAEAEIDAAKPFEFAFELTTRPEFDLPTWKGREVKVPAVSVDDAAVDEAVESLRMAEGTLETSDEPLVLGDVAVVDWTASVDGARVDGGEGAYYRLGRGVMEGIALEGADPALVGGKAGATATVRGRTAADDPREGLAGREFDVAMTVRETKRFEPAALDEAFLKRRDFDDVEELRRDVRRRLLRQRERERDRVAEDRLVESIATEASITLPKQLVDDAVGGWAERRRIEARESGASEEDVARTLSAGEAKVRADVEADLRRYFVLDRIAEAEGLSVSEEELVGAVEQMARESGRSAGEVVQHFQEDPSRIAELRAHLRHRKAREALRKAATVVEETAAPPAKEPPGASPTGRAAPKKGK
jgi:trigger factor